MIPRFFIYADAQSISLLEEPGEKILLVGGDFGYGNFGDVLQHTNSISFHRELGRFRTVSIMATNAIGDCKFPEFVRSAYGCDAAVFVSEFPLDLAESNLPLKPVRSIRNASALHLYGGGFLNDKWGDFVLGVTEYLLHILHISTYVVSGQQVTRPYESRVVRHVDTCQPILFGVRDSLSQQWLDEAGYRTGFSFDDATEALQSLSARLPVRRGKGLLLHLNVSDYTDNGLDNTALVAELEMVAGHGCSRHGATILQAFSCRRGEVSDSREAIKELERAFPFYDYRLVELTGLAYQPGTVLPAGLHGELGYSCSYHVALWLQLAGIPCWLRGSNAFYQQKTTALQVRQDLSSFLKDPYLADHSTNLEQRAQWQEELRKVLLAAPECSIVCELPQPEEGAALPFRFKATPTLRQRAEAAESLLQKLDAEERGLREQNQALNAQLTKVGAIAHDNRQRADESLQREQEAETRLREQNQALNSQIQGVAAIAHDYRRRADAAEASLVDALEYRQRAEAAEASMVDALDYRQRAEAAEASLVDALARLESVVASKSWKITRPLRGIRRVFSRFLGEEKMKSQSFRAFAQAIYHRLPLSQRAKWRLRARLQPLLAAIQDSPSLGKMAKGAVAVVRPDPGNVQLGQDYGREYALAAILAAMEAHALRYGPVRYWIALPFLATGGAEMVALNLCRAVRQLRPDQSVALLITDRRLVSERMVIPEGAKLVVFDDYLGQDLSYERKQALLRDLLVAARPECFHNINSEVAWHLILADGERLKRFTRLFASIFAFQFAPDGRKKIGYAAYFLKQGMPHLAGLLSDNQRFVDDAVVEYEFSVPECSRMFVLYQPCRLLHGSGHELARERVARRLEALATDSCRSGRPQILWAGRLDAEKRVDLFLDVVRCCPFADFRVFGQVVLEDGAALPTLPNLTYEGPFSSPLEWLEKFDFDAFLFTSRWEGMPNILIEVGALGIPVIAPTVGGVGELVTAETGYPLPEQPSASDYQLALNAVVQQPQEAERRAARMLERIVQRHTWEGFVGALAEVPGYLGPTHCGAGLEKGLVAAGGGVANGGNEDLPLVSVVIPCFNQARYLHESISSVLAACHHPIEIIVVDDGGADARTGRYLSEVEQLAPGVVRILSQVNQGLSGARNKGIALARGQFIQFLDADDLLAPGKIDAQVAQLLVNPALDVSVCNFLLCDESRSTYSKPEEAIARFDLSVEDFLYRWERGFAVPIHCGLFRRRVLDGAHFDTSARAKEDWLFWTSLALAGRQFGYIHGHWAIYRQHEGSMRRSYVNMGRSWLQAGLKIDGMLGGREPLFFESVVSWFEQCYRSSPNYRSEIAEIHAGLNRTAPTLADTKGEAKPANDAAVVSEAILNRLSASFNSTPPPLISVVIPVYGHYDYLQACLESLASQGDVSIEIICVDDASPDPRVATLMRSLANKLPRLKISIQAVNTGISTVQNLAVGLACGEFVAFLDCDDELEPGALAAVRDCLQAHPEVDYVFTDRIDVDEKGRKMRLAAYGGYEGIRFSGQGNIRSDLLDGMVASHLKVLRRSVYLEVGGCDAMFAGVQDWDLALKIADKHCLHYLAAPLYRHRVHSQSVTRSDMVAQFRKTNQVRRRYIERWFPRNESQVSGFNRLIFPKARFPLALSELKLAWKDGAVCVADTIGELNIFQINFLREFCSYFDEILWSDPKVPIALSGYLNREVRLVMSSEVA